LKSIVIPVYNEEEMVPVAYERLLPFLEPDDELLFVNDGSTDRTIEKVDRVIQADERVSLINFSRNFGHQPAVTAGLRYARGEAVIVMDCDMQDPPELIPLLMEQFKAGFDIVHCVRKKRKENMFKRLAYNIFYYFYTKMTDFPTVMHSGDFALMSRRVVEEINRMPEKVKFIRGLRAYVGFNQTKIEYERPSREKGEPKYNLRKLMILAFDGLFSFTTFPLRLLTFIGILLLAFTFIVIVMLIYLKFTSRMIVGTTMTYVLILFFSGINLICFGIIGEYIGKIFYETKRRPQYLIESLINLPSREDKK
jgi:dolichol-phosphate mannosyltransferase